MVETTNYYFDKDTGKVTYNLHVRYTQEELMAYCREGGQKADHCGALIKLNSWKIPKDYPWL